MPGARPREERHDAPRRPHLVAVVEMVGLRIVEVHRALHEPEPEQPAIEVEVPLRVTRDRGDVVNTQDVAHVALRYGGALGGARRAGLSSGALPFSTAILRPRGWPE